MQLRDVEDSAAARAPKEVVEALMVAEVRVEDRRGRARLPFLHQLRFHPVLHPSNKLMRCARRFNNSARRFSDYAMNLLRVRLAAGHRSLVVLQGRAEEPLAHPLPDLPWKSARECSLIPSTDCRRASPSCEAAAGIKAARSNGSPRDTATTALL
jgi:hypothetical protein